LKKPIFTPARKRILAGLLLFAAAAYGLDDLSVRFGVPARAQFSTVLVSRFYYVHEKFNKFSYEPLPSVNERCVNALMPHSGSRPCWYVQRHPVEMIDLN
jgi:hypothetical protein